MATLFAKLQAKAQEKQAAKKNDTFISESVEVRLQTLSNPIVGKSGRFREFVIDGIKFYVNDADVVNAEMFVPNCRATVTTTSYTNKDGEEKQYVSHLSVSVRDGMYVARRD